MPILIRYDLLKINNENAIDLMPIQIREFVDFRDKLQRSFQYKSASTERLLLDLILETNSHASTEQMLTYIEVDPSKGKIIYSFM